MASIKNKGFTLIELMLSMTFVAVLLVTMILAIIHISSTYTKGVTIKSINQAGRDIYDTLKRDGVKDGMAGEPIQPAEGGGLGRACLGNYSYLWNEASSLQDGGSPVNYEGTDTPIIFARVYDTGARYCEPLGAGGYEMIVQRDDSVEMLPADNGDYALHLFTMERTPAFDQLMGDSPIYHIRYVIGTNGIDTMSGDIATLDRSCRPPSDNTNNFNFCSINTFELILKAEQNL